MADVLRRVRTEGDACVNEAKRQVFGAVGIDQLAGPSEIYVLADATANAETIATDLLAQAEHDVRTRVGLITTDAASCVPESMVRARRAQRQAWDGANTLSRWPSPSRATKL